MRENLFKKHGAYNNNSDLIECNEFLSKYKKTQAEIETITAKNSKNTHSFTNTYPLAYNAYNLDEESPSKKKNKDTKSSDTNSNDKITDEKEKARISLETSEKEKEEIVKKIFG